MGWVILAILTVYMLSLLFLWVFQRGIIYRPGSERPDPKSYSDYEISEISIRTSDNLELLGWWLQPREVNSPTVLYFHGNAGSLGYRVEKVVPYLNKGYGVLLFAWRGYSGNKGSPEEEGLYKDGAAALKWLREQNISLNKIILYGESLGTAVAVHLATKVRALCLILETPFSSLVETAQQKYWMFPTYWLVRDRFNSDEKISSVEIPILIGHGGHDRVIPLKLSKKLYNLAKQPKKFIFYPAASHTNLGEFGWSQEVINFVEETLRLSKK